MSEEQDSVQKLLEEMKRENGQILAHPMMFVSALHNKEGCYPVNQDDPFFKDNGIKFLDCPQGTESEKPPPEADLKYVVTIDDTGAYRHKIIKVKE